MKIEHRGGMKNKADSAGFVNIEDFEGTTMRISRELLKQSIAIIEKLDEVGIDSEYINIGISKNHPEDNTMRDAGAFFVFLDAKKALAYAVAGVYAE